MIEKWSDLCSSMSRYWSKVEEEDLRQLDGREDELTELIQQRYQCPRPRAIRDIQRFFEIRHKLDR
jgi:hypothetical protein